MGSSYYPAGPHGERQEPYEVPLHPGDRRNNPQPAGFGSEQPAPFPVRTDTGWNAADGFANIVCSFLLVSFSWALWACLYPMPTMAGLSVFLAALPFFQSIILRFDPTAGAVALVLAFTLGMMAVVKLSRVEHRLARYAIYRRPRHLVRLVLFGVLAMRSIVQDTNVVPRPGEPIINVALLQNRQNQVIIIAVIGFIHLLLWKGGWVRRFWHGRLEAIGLRAR